MKKNVFPSWIRGVGMKRHAQLPELHFSVFGYGEVVSLRTVKSVRDHSFKWDDHQERQLNVDDCE